MKKVTVALLLAAFSVSAFAQSGTNSPYSQYGLGALSDQTSGFNRGMNGLGYGLRENNQVNFLNPASYSALDSLTFIFDAGISGQITNFEEKGIKKNANNADFEYIVAGLRLARHMGLSFGLVPFTNVGYNYSNQTIINVDGDNLKTTSTNSFSGSGGLHQLYLGVGWQPFSGLSVGVNAAYLWGNISKSVNNTFSDPAINTLSNYYNDSIKSYKVDFGIQYAAHLSKKDQLIVGATYGLGHRLNDSPHCRIVSNNPQTNVTNTQTYQIDNGLEIPTSIGVGLAWYHNDKWKIGADYQLQQWSKTQYPVYSIVNNIPQYKLTDGMFSDRNKVTLGGEYFNNERSRNFFKTLRYRAGVSYATPYLKINGQDGPKEYSVSAGFGIPIMNAFNNRSILNISAQWVRMDSQTFIKENTFRINIGLTFNEHWFAKWKVE